MKSNINKITNIKNGVIAFLMFISAAIIFTSCKEFVITEGILKNSEFPFKRITGIPGHVHNSRYYTAVSWKFDVSDDVPQNGNVDLALGETLVIIASTHPGWPGQSINNGKLYQTVLLEAGRYRFDVTVAETNYASDPNVAKVFFAAAMGNKLPDINDVEQQALGFTSPRRGVRRAQPAGNLENDETFSFEFVVREKSNVTLGVVATFLPYQGGVIDQIHFRKFELWRK